MNMMLTEAYSEPCQTSKMELIGKKVNSFQPLTIFARMFDWVLDTPLARLMMSSDRTRQTLIIFEKIKTDH